MSEVLYGRNAVRECLRARRRQLHRLYLAKNLNPHPLLQEIAQQTTRLRIPVFEVQRNQLDKYGTGHQGVALEVGPHPGNSVDELLAQADQKCEMPFLLALDHLEDPQNVGALLRTAEAVGVQGVIIPERRAVGITPAVVKASAGASEHLPVAIVTNLVQTLKTLKQKGVWVIGAEKTTSAQPYHTIDLNMPLVLVLGSEGKGLARLVAETCDLLLAIPMQGHVNSLNVSVAGGLLLFEAWRARQGGA